MPFKNCFLFSTSLDNHKASYVIFSNETNSFLFYAATAEAQRD